jgi:hypothetical protein
MLILTVPMLTHASICLQAGRRPAAPDLVPGLSRQAAHLT